LNTRIGYHYTDHQDCRRYASVVVAGTITWEQIDPYLASAHSFIPGQVGLEDLQHRFKLPGADHSWHQIAPGDIRPTEAAPTVALTGDELARRFATTRWDSGWYVGSLPAPTFLGTLLAPVDPAPQADARSVSPAWPTRRRERRGAPPTA
jgi:hypothetical protein